MINPSYRILRFIIACWLFGWLIKIPFFWEHLFHDVLQYPMSNAFFPSFFNSPSVSGTAYLMPILMIPLLWGRQRLFYVSYAVIAALSSVILALHFNTCNDATFVSSTWVGLWLIVFAWHLDRMDLNAWTHTKTLGLCLIGLFFLGGTVGKLFHEFETGQTIYSIFFESRPYWPHTWIREALSLPQQHQLAAVVAKCIIAVEGLLIFAPVWPPIITLGLLLLTLTVMVIFCSYNILSVNSCLLGVGIACVWIDKLAHKTQIPSSKLQITNNN